MCIDFENVKAHALFDTDKHQLNLIQLVLTSGFQQTRLIDHELPGNGTDIMGTLTTIALIVLSISFLVFVAFFGRIPALRFVFLVRLCKPGLRLGQGAH